MSNLSQLYKFKMTNMNIKQSNAPLLMGKTKYFAEYLALNHQNVFIYIDIIDLSKVQ